MSVRILAALVPIVLSIAACRSSSGGCSVGASAACACTNGRTGAQICLMSNSYGTCNCTLDITTGCVPGQSVACACSDGTEGAQVCQADRTLAACQCDHVDAGTACTLGRAVACACPDGASGAQICEASLSFGPCICLPAATDAGSTAGSDAGIDVIVDTSASTLPYQTVLDFPNPANDIAVHVNHGLFWAQNADLGTSFFWDAYVAPRTSGYLVSDGYGGAHAMLWGPELSDGQMIFKGNIWNGQANVMYTATEGPAPGEWGYHAISLVKTTKAYIYNYWNGITIGITPFGDTLTRHSASSGMGNGILYVMGSTHQNLGGRLAALRVWDRASPFAASPNPAVAFVPERAFAAELPSFEPADFLADYTRPAIEIADLAPVGYAGGGLGPALRHPGRILNSAGVPPDWTFETTRLNPGPLAQWVMDTGCPYGVAGQLAPNPNEVIPAKPAPPAKALVFDSFNRRSQNFLWQQVPTLGQTEGGTLGPLDWQTGVTGALATPRVPAPWGIINGRAVYLENQPGVAWVDVKTADQDVKLTRFTNITPTGIAFRVQDRQNFWFLSFPPDLDPLLPAAIQLGYFQAGIPHAVANYIPPDGGWRTMRVRAVGSTIAVLRDDVTVGQVANAVQLQTATGAGMTGAIDMPTASSFWRGDNFTVCSADGC